MSAAATAVDLDEPFQVDMQIGGRKMKRLVSIRQLYELAKGRDHQVVHQMLQDFPDLEPRHCER
jgi:hypothetical protein